MADPIKNAKGILSGESRRQKIDQAEKDAMYPKPKKPSKPKPKKPKKSAAQATRDSFWD